MYRRNEAIKKWLPLVAVASAISFLVLILIKIPPERAIIATGLLALLIFSGFFFRLFGRDKDKYGEHKHE